MSNKARHQSSSTKLTFYKYYNNPSEVMLNNDHPKDNFSTAKASSFVNVTKKRKVNEKLDTRKDQNFDDIQTNLPNATKEHKHSSPIYFCSMNEQFNDDSVINGGNHEKIAHMNSFTKQMDEVHGSNSSDGKYYYIITIFWLIIL